MSSSRSVVSELLIGIAYGQWYLSNGFDVEPDSADSEELLAAAIEAGGFAQVGDSMAVLTPEIHTGDLPLQAEVWARSRGVGDPDGYRGHLTVGPYGVIVSNVDSQEWRIDAAPADYDVTVVPGDAVHDPPIPWRLQLFPSAPATTDTPATRRRRSPMSIEQKRQRLREVNAERADGFFWDLMRIKLDADYNELLWELAPTVTNPVCINLYRTGLTELPRWLCRVPNMWELLAHYNKITTIPSWFTDLPKLRRFAIASNRDFATIPDLICDLPALNRLEFDGTAIKRIPESMATMTGLEHLQIQQTPLTELPEWIGRLTGLRYLDLSDTAVTRLPDSIGDLTNLEYLALDNTTVSVVPDSLATLPKLREVNLNHTQIAALPPGLLDRDQPVDVRVYSTPYGKSHRKRRP